MTKFRLFTLFYSWYLARVERREVLILALSQTR